MELWQRCEAGAANSLTAAGGDVFVDMLDIGIEATEFPFVIRSGFVHGDNRACFHHFKKIQPGDVADFRTAHVADAFTRACRATILALAFATWRSQPGGSSGAAEEAGAINSASTKAAGTISATNARMNRRNTACPSSSPPLVGGNGAEVHACGEKTARSGNYFLA